MKRGEIQGFVPKNLLNITQHDSGYVELSKALDNSTYPNKDPGSKESCQ